MPTNYIYKGCEFHLDETLFNDYLLDAVYEINQGACLIHRLEVICDSPNLQNYYIEELSKQIPNIVLLDGQTCESHQDFFLKREELARNGATIVIINHEHIIDKMNFSSSEEKKTKFYNLGINFSRDYLANENIPLKEIMFFSNSQYRDYIKHAYDISSMSQVISLNKALVSKTDTLDKILESEYLGPIK
ncbi:MAG: hypothetical protein OSJ70_08110 [Bacilli bacterium]|nr:hypothetical protein [Bacilli bacterium]